MLYVILVGEDQVVDQTVGRIADQRRSGSEWPLAARVRTFVATRFIDGSSSAPGWGLC